MVLKGAGVVQIWFSHVPWTKDHAHADKENMYKNIQQYLSGVPDLCFQSNYGNSDSGNNE